MILVTRFQLHLIKTTKQLFVLCSINVTCSSIIVVFGPIYFLVYFGYAESKNICWTAGEKQNGRLINIFVNTNSL